MNLFIYKIALRSYQLLIKAAGPFNKKAKLWSEGRKDLIVKLRQSMKDNRGPVAWFHCASLGEFEQARPVIEKFKIQHSTFKILLTFFSPSGYEIRKNYEKADYIFYLPLDSKRNARRFIEAAKPSIAFFVKYEFWYYYLNELKKNQIPVISFSAIFRKDQLFFRRYGTFYKNILKKFNRIFVQNEESYYLLHAISIKHSEIAGDTRFDRVKEICDQKKNIPIAAKFKDAKKVLVIGSSWPQDMNLLIPFINSFDKDLKVIVAPHELHERNLADMEGRIERKIIRFSRAEESSVNQYDVLIIDNIGMLSSLYQYGEFAYIGGAFGKGLHNILEAATYGMPVFFGPNYSKFHEAVALVNYGTAFPVNDRKEFTEQFAKFWQDESFRLSVAAKSKNFVEKNTGATEKILSYTKKILEEMR
ncbi:MAG: 3-deoxy-D-manno-octulosonic acid transferase [Cytophagaceae bacterium]